jgi:hypothetical protein
MKLTKFLAEENVKGAGGYDFEQKVMYRLLRESYDTTGINRISAPWIDSGTTKEYPFRNNITIRDPAPVHLQKTGVVAKDGQGLFYDLKKLSLTREVDFKVKIRSGKTFLGYSNNELIIIEAKHTARDINKSIIERTNIKNIGIKGDDESLFKYLTSLTSEHKLKSFTSVELAGLNELVTKSKIDLLAAMHIIASPGTIDVKAYAIEVGNDAAFYVINDTHQVIQGGKFEFEAGTPNLIFKYQGEEIFRIVFATLKSHATITAGKDVLDKHFRQRKISNEKNEGTLTLGEQMLATQERVKQQMISPYEKNPYLLKMNRQEFMGLPKIPSEAEIAASARPETYKATLKVTKDISPVMNPKAPKAPEVKPIFKAGETRDLQIRFLK